MNLNYPFALVRAFILIPLQEKIILALPTKVGEVGDYMAMLWMPPNPDHIKIQKITKVEQVEPEGMTGLWEGVSKDDLFTIPL